MASTLYAFLVGINQYDGEVRNLQGCEYDTLKMRRFLRHYASANQLDFVEKTLLDFAATREKVIEGFGHFGPAKEGDICVFYYSGHGSEVGAPPELQHLQADGRLQTLVCHDSRTTAQDLTDKEISHLIWEATTTGDEEKDVHFLAIFDSCHSGSVSRNTALNPRLTPGSLNILPVSSLYGHQQFTGTGNQLSPRIGRHVALSAARSYELAYEKRYKGIPRGVFTTTLLETLEQESLSGLTYGQLAMLINARMHPEVQNIQNPMQEAIGTWADKNQIPLFGRGRNRSYRHYMWFDRHQQSWMVNAGMMEGVVAGQKLTVMQGDIPHEVEVRAADEVGQSRLLPGDWAQNDAIYPVDLPIEKEVLAVSWDVDLSSTARDHLKKSLGDSVLLVEPEDADYLIKQEHGQLVIVPIGSERPLFEGVNYPDTSAETTADLFAAQVEHVARWIYLWKKGNPDTRLHVPEEFHVSLSQFPEFRNDDVPGYPEAVSVENDIPVFSYHKRGGQWEKPVISLSIQRKSTAQSYQGSLWVAVLFFNEKYGVTAQHFPVQEFRMDDQMPVGLYYVSRGRKRFFIPLYIPDVLLSDWGETEVKNQFKIIISNQPFSAEPWELKDLRLARRMDKGIGRGLGGEENDFFPVGDWATLDIPFIIRRPLEGRTLSTSGSVQFDQLNLQAPEGFSAQSVSLTSSMDVSRSLAGRKAPLTIPGCVEPLNLSSSRKADEAFDVMELHEPAGEQVVSPESPILLKMSGGIREAIVPMGYDAELGTYLPIGFTDAKGMVRIQALPGVEPATTRGLGKSLKIYLQRLKYTRLLGKADPYPKLAMVGWESDQALYISHQDDIRKAVASAKKVLVVVHGLIGDTSDKRELTRRITREVDGKEQCLDQVFDLTLTFDYDSLSVPVEQTARDLKTALEKVGCKKSDGREVVLIAHSMGGLVSRWMLEKEHGDALISAFVEVGSPNAGSPWASSYDVFMMGLGTVINYLPLPGVVNALLSFVEKAWDHVEVTQKQLRPDSPLVDALNQTVGLVPIPYLIVPGDSSLIPDPDGKRKRLVAKLFSRLGSAVKTGAIKMLFDAENDDIVSVESMTAVPPGNVTITDSAACDHFGYFNTDAGLERLGDVLWEV